MIPASIAASSGASSDGAGVGAAPRRSRGACSRSRCGRRPRCRRRPRRSRWCSGTGSGSCPCPTGARGGRRAPPRAASGRTVRLSCASSAFLTNCRVIVEAPWVEPPGITSATRARPMPWIVDAAVLVEALVLDRDHGLLDVGRDVLGLDQDPLVVGEQRADLARPRSRTPRSSCACAYCSLFSSSGRSLATEHHHPEHGRDHRQQRRGRPR